MRFRLSGLLAAIALIAVPLMTGAAQAQDWRQAPAFGAVTLNSGFTPDPYYRDLTAGGTLDASRVLGGNCLGTIANAPDFRMNFNAGGFGYALTIFVESYSDTTLVVNTPDGRWHCNDDWNHLNPGISFSAPMSGQYDIWVGSYERGRGIPARLYVTELY